MDRRHWLCALLFLLTVGCAMQRQPRLTQVNLDEYTPYDVSGTAVIYGDAFLKTRSGDVKKGAGNKINLNPVTTYSTEWFERMIIGSQLLVQADMRVHKYHRETIADSDGKFEFEGLPPGDYYLACRITWEVPIGYGQTSVTGGWAYAKVTVKAGERKKVTLTR